MLDGQGHRLKLLQVSVVLSRLDNLLREVKATLVLVPLSPHRLLPIVIVRTFEKVAGGIIGWPLCRQKEVVVVGARETVGMGVRSIARGKR